MGSIRKVFPLQDPNEPFGSELSTSFGGGPPRGVIRNSRASKDLTLVLVTAIEDEKNQDRWNMMSEK